MKHLLGNCLFPFIIFFTLSNVAFSNQADTKVVFGVYTSDKASTMYKTFKPVIGALGKSMSTQAGHEIKIHLKIYKSYDEGIAGLIKGDVDFMRLGPASYILTKMKNPDVRLLAMEVRKGKKKFRGVILVSDKSHAKTLIDLKGKSFAFGNPSSTIGRYLAQAELIDAGLHASDFSKIDFLGRHDKVASAVAIGDFDAGSVKEKTFLKAKKKGGVKALHYFDNVTKPWVASSSLDKTIFNYLQTALTELKDKSILKVLKVDRFDKGTDAEYNFVRKGMKKSESF